MAQNTAVAAWAEEVPDAPYPINAKAMLYLAAGVRLVWLVGPAQRKVEVWRPGSATPLMALGLGDTLDGLDVVPGFTYSLARLFGQ